MKINLNTVKKTERAGFFFNMKMLMPSIFFIIFIFVLLYACGGSNNSSDPNPAAPANTEEPANDNPDNDNPDNDNSDNDNTDNDNPYSENNPIRFNNLRWGNGYFYCALLIDQTLGCWSDDTVITKRSDKQFIQTSSYGGHYLENNLTCAIDTSNNLYCANGKTEDLARVETDQKFNYVEVGQKYQCALSTTNKLFCWGDNDNGQLGTGDTETQNTPTPVSNDHDFVHFALSGDYFLKSTCAIKEDGTAYCWGQNDNGQLGIGNRDNPVLEPTPVATDIKFRQIYLFESTSCGLSLDYKLFCWGDNYSAENNTSPLFAPSNTPVEVPTGDLKFKKISGYKRLICGLTDEGSIYCERFDSMYGVKTEAFTNNYSISLVPNPDGKAWVKVNTEFKFVNLSIDSTPGCNMGLTSDNELYCSGQSDPSLTTRRNNEDHYTFYQTMSSANVNIEVILP